MVLLCWTNQAEIGMWSPCDHECYYPYVDAIMGVIWPTNNMQQRAHWPGCSNSIYIILIPVEFSISPLKY